MPYQLSRGVNGQTVPILDWTGGLQTVEFTSGGSTQSTSVGAATSIVVLFADAACYFAIGSNPTAAGTGLNGYLDAGHYIHHPIGGTHKVAARGVTGSGNLRIMEVPSDE